MLVERGRIEIRPGNVQERILALVGETGFVVCSLDANIALLARELPFTHHDPADRFVAATAYSLGCPLATVDQKLIGLPWLETVQS